jgi:hypothetical protein
VKRIPFNLRALQAARHLRAGFGMHHVQRDTGVNPRQLRRIQQLYATVPDELLERMERLLTDQDKLRSIIATLTSVVGNISSIETPGA